MLVCMEMDSLWQGFDSNVKDLNVHFFLLILMVGSLGESHAIGFTPRILAIRPSRFFHENLGSPQKKR